MKERIWLLGFATIFVGMIIGVNINCYAGIALVIGGMMFALYFLKNKHKK